MKIRDPAAKRRALLREPWCVLECGRRSVDPHHVLFKSQGGDDVEANLVGLCRECHDLITNEDRPTRRKLGDFILDARWDTLRYLEGKLGETWREWIRRRLCVRVVGYCWRELPSAFGGTVDHSHGNAEHLLDGTLAEDLPARA